MCSSLLNDIIITIIIIIIIIIVIIIIIIIMNTKYEKNLFWYKYWFLIELKNKIILYRGTSPLGDLCSAQGTP